MSKMVQGYRVVHGNNFRGVCGVSETVSKEEADALAALLRPEWRGWLDVEIDPGCMVPAWNGSLCSEEKCARGL